MKVSQFLVFSFFLALLVGGTGACTFDKGEELLDCTLLENIELVTVNPAACGSASGSIEVVAKVDASFSGEVTFTLNGTDDSTTPVFENLLAGTYQVSALINGDCAQSISVVVENEDGLNITVDASPSDCGAANGEVKINANGATGVVTFSLDGVEQSDNTFGNLAPGKYQVLVTDAASCSVSQEVSVTSNVAFSEIGNIISSNCAVSGCHAGNVNPDLSTPANIEAFANRIKARTSNQTMPPPSTGNTLSNAAIDAIACWVDDLN